MCSTVGSLTQVSLSDLGAASFEGGTQIGAGIHDLFRYSLSQRLKHARIRLMAGDGQVVVLRLAGAKSRYAGQVLITDERPYSRNTYFGRISVDGLLIESREMTVAVRELLERFAANPREVAFLYGQLTGRCCFCRIWPVDAGR